MDVPHVVLAKDFYTYHQQIAAYYAPQRIIVMVKRQQMDVDAILEYGVRH
jgi:hypothetical protein